MTRPSAANRDLVPLGLDKKCLSGYHERMRKILTFMVLLLTLSACTPEQLQHYFGATESQTASDVEAAEPTIDFESREVQIAAQDWWCDGRATDVDIYEALELLWYGPAPVCDAFGVRLPPGWTVEFRHGNCPVPGGDIFPGVSVTSDGGDTGHVCVNVDRPRLAWTFTLYHEAGHAWGLFIRRHPNPQQEYEPVMNCVGVIMGGTQVLEGVHYAGTQWWISPPRRFLCPGAHTWQWDLAVDLAGYARAS